MNEHKRSSEEELIVQAQAGDQLAFRRLRERYRASLKRYVLKCLGALPDMDDVVNDIEQKTWVKAWRKLKTLSDATKFEAWLFRIAKNEASTLRKRQNRFMSMDDLDFEPAAPDAVKGVKDDIWVSKLLDRLRDDQRVAIIFYFFEKRSYEEIAKITGVTVGTVSSRLNRAKSELKRLIEIEESG